MLAVVGLGLSACGGGSGAPGVAGIGSTSTTVQPAAAASSNAANFYQDELKFSECMRSHGVASFPDPSAGGGFRIPAGVKPSSSASVACQKLLPGSGLGSGSPPTAAALALWLKVSRCMRAHGVADFPDPRTSVPPNRAGIGEISDRDGVILVFPLGFDEQSPQFKLAAAACGFRVTNH